MRVGFIGTGNMATAIIKGIIVKVLSVNKVYLTDLNLDKAKSLADTVGLLLSNQQLIESVDYVILAVKPNVMEQVLESRDEINNHKPPCITALVHRQISYTVIYKHEKVPIVRVMPNVNVMVGMGVGSNLWS